MLTATTWVYITIAIVIISGLIVVLSLAKDYYLKIKENNKRISPLK